MRSTRDYRPDHADYTAAGAVGPGLKALRKARTDALILTPCPPRNHCHVCETRLDAVFGSADKTAKYRHQAAEAGQAAVQSMRAGAAELAVAQARRAWAYAQLVTAA